MSSEIQTVQLVIRSPGSRGQGGAGRGGGVSATHLLLRSLGVGVGGGWVGDP